MKNVIDFKSRLEIVEAQEMCKYIMSLIRGNVAKGVMTERNRQFFTWGAKNFVPILSECGCRGLQFNVSGLLHKGRVRVWYNPASDYFDVELLFPIRNVVAFECEDLDFEDLHNVLHQHIERTDDPKVFFID